MREGTDQETVTVSERTVKVDWPQTKTRNFLSYKSNLISSNDISELCHLPAPTFMKHDPRVFNIKVKKHKIVIFLSLCVHCLCVSACHLTQPEVPPWHHCIIQACLFMFSVPVYNAALGYSFHGPLFHITFKYQFICSQSSTDVKKI